MVPCRSCGRTITSGTLRCRKCGSAYHLSCSHRYQITQDGVFSFCCGFDQPVYPNNLGYQARYHNKRRQHHNPFNNAYNFPTTSADFDDNRRYGKIMKVEDMGINEKPVIDIHDDVIIKESFNTNCNRNQVYDLDSSDPEIILDASSDDVIIESNNDDIYIEHINDDVIIDASNDDVVIESHIQRVPDDKSFNNKITLETVWQGISSLQSSISNISNSLDTVSTHLNTFDPRMNELESTLNVIKNKTSNFDHVCEDVNVLKSQLEHVTSELEYLKSQPERSFDMSDIVSEVRERNMKSKNILIYNVTEDNLRISQDYSTIDDINQFNALLASRDTSRAREILADIPNVDLDEIQTKRLGRPNQNRCRPLRVTLQSREDVIMVMKNKNLINNTYNVKTDLTKIQQRKIRELRQELEKININKNDPTMTIKFISGEPKIVPIRRPLKSEN